MRSTTPSRLRACSNQPKSIADMFAIARKRLADPRTRLASYVMTREEARALETTTFTVLGLPPVKAPE